MVTSHLPPQPRHANLDLDRWCGVCRSALWRNPATGDRVCLACYAHEQIQQLVQRHTREREER